MDPVWIESKSWLVVRRSVTADCNRACLPSSAGSRLRGSLSAGRFVLQLRQRWGKITSFRSLTSTYLPSLLWFCPPEPAEYLLHTQLKCIFHQDRIPECECELYFEILAEWSQGFHREVSKMMQRTRRSFLGDVTVNVSLSVRWYTETCLFFFLLI